MRITILNGDPDPASEFDAYVSEVASHLGALGHAVTKLNLVALDLKGCSGCWGCWLRTPGECAKRDDSARICRSILHADLVVAASPMRMGFTTALLKSATDQMIPLVHPYFVFSGGEIHHRARYASYPKFGLLLGAGPDSDAEDIEITIEIWRRTARNLQSRLVVASVTDRAAMEVANELTSVA